MNHIAKKIVSLFTCAFLVLGAGCSSSNATTTTEATGAYTDGTYTASAKGMNGDVPVTVVVENGNITEVTVGENSETEGIGTNAIEQLPSSIVEANSPDVETISGATITSDAIIKAVKIALGLEAPEEPTSATPDYTTTSADVIVVGAGLTGLTAAARVADLGHSVILFEQSDVLGGNSRVAGGYISGACTDIQKEYGIDDSPQLAFEDLVDIGGRDYMNPQLAWTHVQRAGEMVNWVNETLGVELSEPGHGAYTPTNVARVYITETGGMEYIDALEAYIQPYLDDQTITLYMNSKVDSIVTDENGVITGVTANGTTFNASQIILATGGYAYNEEWINRYNFENVRSQSPATADGSGYDLAESVGASFSNMDYMPAYPGALDVDDDTFSTTVIADASGWEGSIWVDINGNRLFDEVGFSTAERQSAWENAEHNYVYMVFTQEMMDNAQTPVLDVDANNGNWDKFNELLAAGDEVFSGSTIEEAAQAAGIDPQGLATTIERYNGFVQSGVDEDFGRTERLESFDSNTYYIVRTVPYVLLSKGGVDINTSAQVLREDGSVIDGLYAGGELIGGANIGGHASHGALACVSTFVWGTIAAESACSQLDGETIHVDGYTEISTEVPSYGLTD